MQAEQSKPVLFGKHWGRLKGETTYQALTSLAQTRSSDWHLYGSERCYKFLFQTPNETAVVNIVVVLTVIPVVVSEVLLIISNESLL